MKAQLSAPFDELHERRHVILSALSLNPQGIGGLEIVSCTVSGFERFDSKRLDELRKFSYGLDDDIRQKLGVPRW